MWGMSQTGYTDGFAVAIPLVLQDPEKSLPLPGSPPTETHCGGGQGAQRWLVVGTAFPWLSLVVKAFP